MQITKVPAAVQAIWPAARRERRELTLVSVLGVVGVVVDLARPWPLALAVEAVVARRTPFGLPFDLFLIGCGVAVVAVTAAAGWLDMTATVRSERAAERIGAGLRQQVFDHAIGLSLRWHDATRSGELMSRLTTDVGRLLDALVALCSTLVPDAVRLAVVLTVLFVIDPWLAFVALAVVPILGVLATRQRRRVRDAQDDARSTSGRFAATSIDLLRNVRTVQAFGRSSEARYRFGSANRDLLAANSHAVRVEARWRPLADVTLAVGTGLVLAVGGQRALTGQMDPGQLIVVMSYLSALYSPVRSLSRLSGVLAKAGASARRVHDVLATRDQVREPTNPVPTPAVTREVRFAGVRFGYDAHRAPVLDDFDLTLRAGETVCLYGPSGVGKSTVLHLLLRLYDVDAGTITIDGVDLRSMGLTALRRQIAFVPQDPWLLDASVTDNIAFGAPQATRHGVLRAARLARVDEFVDRLPAGYDTVLGEGAARLSGGQRRRIALARAVVSEAPLVLLDEPTASLDPAGAAAIVDAVRNSTRGRTVLLVTHDRDLAATADRVVEVRPTTGVHRAPDRDHQFHPLARKEVPA